MKKRAKAVITILVCFSVLFIGISFSDATELSQIEKVWGKPSAVQSLSNGAEKYFYPRRDGLWKYTYFVLKGGAVVDQGASREIGIGAAQYCDSCLQSGG